MTRQLVAFLFAAAALPALGQAAPSCRMGQVAEWTLSAGYPSVPVIEADVAGKRIAILVSTTATRTIITRAAATRLGAKIAMMQGQEYAQLEGLRSGGATPISLQALISEGTGPFGGGFDMVVGLDVLSRYDVEFDPVGDKVRLFRAEGCANASLAYWDKSGVVAVPMESVESRFPVVAVGVIVNGRPMRAMVSTGVATSMLDLRQAREAGVTPDSPDTEPAGCMAGASRSRVDTWRGTFDTVAIGAQVVRNARLRFGPFLGLDRTHAPDMFIAYDFFRSHRVLIANSQKRVYFSHVEGPAFPVPGRGRTCAESEKPRSLAEVEAYLLKYPRDAGALAERAYFRAEARDIPGALADLEAARAIEPDQPAIGVVAARIHRHQGDAQRALEEVDRALRLRPDLGHAWVEKGQALYALGRIDDAVAAYTAGIEADPRNPESWLARGLVLAGVDEFDRATADFEALQKRSSSTFATTLYRGNMMNAQGRYDRALLLVEEAKRLSPDAPGPYLLRSRVLNRQGDRDGALAEIARAGAKGATRESLEEALGWTHFLAGNFAQATTHMANELAEPGFERYLPLWLHIARSRSGGDGRKEMAAALDRIGAAWPAPLYRLMLGTTDPEGAAPRDPEDKPLSRRGHGCEHRFFTGQWHSLHGRAKEAREAFQAAIDTCPRAYREYPVALVELKRLGP